MRMSEAEAPKLAGMKYEVESILSSSGPTTVMLVNDPKAFSKRFVVKLIKREDEKQDSLLARAEATCEASGKLKHPGVLSVHDFKLSKQWFKVNRGELLMEYVEGKPLMELKGLSVPQWLLVFRQVASALAHMHRRKVLHGNLEPGHIVLGRNGQSKLINYGLALAPVEGRFEPARGFAAPEVVREKRILESSDVYSLGAVMYQMLTGRAFAAAAGKGKGKEGGDEAVKMPNPAGLNPNVPAALGNLVVACLHRHAPRRIQSPYEVHQQLDEMVVQAKLDDERLVGLTARSE